MPKRITIARIAEEAAVSSMTASNVIHNRPGASDATRQRVLEVAERLGYVAPVGRRRRRAGTTGLIGVVSLDPAGPYGLEILRGISEELSDDDREIVLRASEDPERQSERIDFFAHGLVDGLILIAPILDDAVERQLAAVNIPIVIVDPRRIDVGFPRVTADNYQGVRRATEYLLELGHRRIGYIRGADGLESSHLRYQGYADAMRIAGETLDGDLTATSSFSYNGGFTAATRLLQNGHPTAIIGGADVIAIGAMDAARALDLDIPDDLSIVGFDDLPQAADTSPALTTVRQPLHDMGQAGARAVVALVDHRTLVTENIRFDTSLIIRDTTRPISPEIDLPSRSGC